MLNSLTHLGTPEFIYLCGILWVTFWLILVSQFCNNGLPFVWDLSQHCLVTCVFNKKTVFNSVDFRTVWTPVWMSSSVSPVFEQVLSIHLSRQVHRELSFRQQPYSHIMEHTGHSFVLSWGEVRVLSCCGESGRASPGCGQVLQILLVSSTCLFFLPTCLGELCSPNWLLEHSEG